MLLGNHLFCCCKILRQLWHSNGTPIDFFHKVCHQWGHLRKYILSANEANMFLIRNPSWISCQVCHLCGCLCTKSSATEAATDLIGNPLEFFIKFFIYLVVYGLNNRSTRKLRPS